MRLRARAITTIRQIDKAMWIKISILELRDSRFKSYIQSKFKHLEQLTNLDTISNQTDRTINLIINWKHNTHEIE